MRASLRLIIPIHFLFCAWSLAADIQIRNSPNKDSEAAIAYNSTNDEYLVVWSEWGPAGGGMYILGPVVGQRIRADGTMIGSAFGIVPTFASDASVAYNPITNEYLVVVTSLGGIQGQRVSATGSLIGSSTQLMAAADVAKPEIVYNSIENSYLLIGTSLYASGTPDLCNIRIYSRRIESNGQPGGNVNLLRDQGHGLCTDGPRYAVAFAPITSPETPHGRFLLVIDTPGDLTMLDHNGIKVSKVYDSQHPGNIVDDHVPFQQSKVGVAHNVDVAFGNFEGENVFMVVWGDRSQTIGNQEWTGIWAGIVKATPVEFESNAVVSNSVFPVSAIWAHWATTAYAKTWKPAVAYNNAAHKFMIAWRETPSTDPNNDTKVNHIRANAVSTSLTPPPANVVLSAITGNENPNKPAIAASTKSPNALVVWEDARNVSTTDIDLYGSIFNTTPAKALILTSPNGGEKWPAGTQQQIEWESGDIGSVDVTIEYSLDNGATYNFIAFQTNTDGMNTFNWTVPETTSTQCLVNISVSGLSDNCDATFTIAPLSQITVVSPNGGEVWSIGDQHEITWSSANFPDPVRIDVAYTLNGGTTGEAFWENIAANTPNDGSFTWTVSSLLDSQHIPLHGKIRVADATKARPDSADDGKVFDWSDSLFTLNPAAPITVIAPNGGEVWTEGEQHEIKWISHNIPGNVNIDFRGSFSIKSSDSLHYDLIYTTHANLATNAPNTGSFIWAVPRYLYIFPDCDILVSAASDSKMFDRSDSAFTYYPKPNTFSGNNVNVDLGDGTNVKFDKVDSTGITSQYISQKGPPPPSGWKALPIDSPQYHYIETTSQFSGNIKVCLTYNDSSLTPAGESELRLHVFDPQTATWTNISTSQETSNNIICGEVSHLSAFAIMVPRGNELIVTNTNDSGDGSLRNAIALANTNPGADKTIFNIPKTDPHYDANKGVWVIRPVSYYQDILDSNLVIDGTSQRLFIAEDTNPEGPEIVIDGSMMSTINGCFSVLGNNTQIYELTISNFPSTAIAFGQTSNGIVSGCYIGTDYSGMNSAGNREGISLGYKVNNTLLGPSPYLAQPNLISGNAQNGIFIADSSHNNSVIGNHIGVNRDATDTLQNHLRGIDLSGGADDNTIMGNCVGGNSQGIYVNGSNNNHIRNNYVGTAANGAYDLGNSDGILVFNNSRDNDITDNTVRNNRGWGIKISGANSTGNRISRNSISNNWGLGIDNSDGGNNELIPPVILSVLNNQISGTAGANQVIEIFADSSDEGQVYVDSTVSDASGHFSIALSSSPMLPYITATARDALGNTSEFSSPFIVTDSEGEEDRLPTEYALYQNYPNPFNPTTKVMYAIPKQSFVILRVFDVLGKEVVTLVNEKQSAGKYEQTFSAKNLPSGVYFYQLRTEDHTITKKLLYIQ